MSRPIGAVQLICVSTDRVHLGPVTALCEAGGHMFSAAHDMGLIAWHCPQNLRAKTSLEFQHVSYYTHVVMLQCLIPCYSRYLAGLYFMRLQSFPWRPIIPL